jgi:hypothetical protein
MASRRAIIASLIGASVGVPYVATRLPSGGDKDPLQATSPIFGAPPMRSQPANALPAANAQSAASAHYAASLRLSPEHVFRFDLTKEWVYSHWARKSTGLADADLFGVRVPLVTGTGVSDLAGSLTYYFDAQGVLQHISFHGRTGDPTRLVDFVLRNYKFQATSAPAGEQLYRVTGRRGVQSELRVRPEAVLWSNSPHGSFIVELELARPGSTRVLAPRLSQVQPPR